MKISNLKSKIGHIYGQINMTWLKTVLFAVIAGVYTGLIMLVPALDNTSFQDIGVGYEWWVIFAVIVVVNCKKNWEAMLKCFVFFFLSQPIIFAVEVLFNHITLEQAIQYYRIWLIPTILTLPGGLIAFYCKKQNTVGAIVLGLGNTIQLVLGVSYVVSCVKDFPHHLLSVLVSVISILLMSFAIQKEKKNRIISLVLPVVLTGLLAILAALTGRLNF